MQTSKIIRRDLPAELDKPLHHNALVSRVLAARGVSRVADLDYALKDLPIPESLPDIAPAVQRLALALTEQQRILIIGDYDCDGATSTALCLLALTAMGANHVHYLVPNRFEFGYGLSPEIVDVAVAQRPDLILTVDNGVASVEGVRRATELGIDVIVTDHHLPPDELPAALAIVNPNLHGCRFAGTSLAGVGVIFYVMLALRTYLKQQGWFSGRLQAVPNLANLLDLVAIGTIADVVPLDSINRTLVEQGLRRIRAGHTRPGVLALIQVAGRSAASLSSSDIGFALGPRLNAAGRLDDIGTGIQCLMAGSTAEATKLADELNALNQQRRAIESNMQSEADELVQQTLASLATRQQDLLSLCLFEPHWHQGVLGILAGRLKEQLHVPVLVFASAEDGSLKGSGRSIPGLHIRDALDSVASAHPGLIQKFGGHAMAAGLSLQPEALEDFRIAFDETVSKQLGGVVQQRELETDGELSVEEFSLENAKLLRFIAPWGQNFPEPSFDGLFKIDSCRLLKDRHLKLTVRPDKGGQSIDAIAFNQQLAVASGQLVRLVFRLMVNSFRGRESLQLNVEYIEPA